MHKFKGWIVALLLVVTLSGCGGEDSQKDQKGEAATRTKQLILLLLTTATEKEKDTFPDMSSPEIVKAALQPALTTKKNEEVDKGWSDDVFIHPSSGKPFVPNANLSNLSMAKIDMPANIIAFYAPEPDGEDRIVGYSDGHAEWIKESDWTIKKMAGYVK